MKSLARQLWSALTAATAVGVGVLASAGAHAGPGDHVQLGTATTLAPEIDLGFQYRSNITQSQSNGVGGLNLTVAPGARLSYLTEDNEFNLTGDYRLVKYFTRQTAQADQFNDFDINADGLFMKSSPVGLGVHQRLSLVNNNADRLGNTPFHTRFRSDSQARLNLRPGPLLQIDLGGGFQYDDFKVPASANLGDVRNFNSRTGIGAAWAGQWLFYPHTAFVVEGDLTQYAWERNWVAEGNRGTFLAMPDSTHFRITAGLRGRLTDRVVVAGQAGYGSAPYSVSSVESACGGGAECDPTNPANPFGAKLKGFERLLLIAQVQYQMDEGRVLTVGYRKDFDDVFFTNYMAYNRVYADLSSRFGTRMLGTVSLDVRQESYRGEKQRSDVFLDASGDMSYFLQDWARVTGGLTYQQRISPSSPSVSYNDVQPRVLMTFTY